MTHKLIALLAFVAFAAVSLPAFEAEAETVERVAAIVDDDVLTMQDLRVDGRIRLLSSGQKLEALDMVPNRRGQIEMLLQRMVQTQLLVIQANKLQAPVGNAEVDQRLKMIYTRFGKSEEEYRAIMREMGIPWESLRSFMRDELKSQFVIRSELGGQVNVSDADVEACARERTPDGKSVSKLTLRQILVNAEPQKPELGKSGSVGTLYPAWWNAVDAARYGAARQLYDMAHVDGANFEELARTFSSGRSREKGGLLGDFAKGDLAEEFDPVFELETGAVSNIIETSAGFHIITVEAADESENADWTKTLAACQSDLMQDETAKVIDGWLSNLGDKHFVELKLFNDIAPQ